MTTHDPSRAPGTFTELDSLEPMSDDMRPVRVGRSVNPPTTLFITGEGAYHGEWAAFLTAEQAVDLANELLAYAQAVAGGT